jgi:hydroxymethylpyrimidine/phosphomethylpyrimidine kinase
MNDQAKADRPVVLTIAGFDPSGGAGIIADVTTFVHFEVRPTAAITSLTFQNSEGSFGAIHETAQSVRAQILPITEEHRIAAVKIGMLPTAEIVLEVARLIAEADLPAPVIDPVLRSTAGYELMDSDAVEALLTELIPLARLLTPNIPEAEALSGLSITSEEEMRLAAAKLRDLDVRAVLVKGGHLPGTANEDEELSREAVDVLDHEGQVTVFRGEWIDSTNVRGTGCMLSSAIAACLGKGADLQESVSAAKQFVADRIRQSRSP